MKDSTQGAFNSLTFYFDGPVESMFSFGGFSRFGHWYRRWKLRSPQRSVICGVIAMYNVDQNVGEELP